MSGVREAFPDLGPITWRKFCEMRARLASGEAAFLVGAGADIAVAKIAGWSKLLDGLVKQTPQFRSADPNAVDDLEEISRRFPAEIAYLVRWNMGDERFMAELSKSLRPSFTVDPEDDYVKALKQAFSASNLIVTTNYSNFVEQILRMIPGKDVIVRDREELSTFNFPPVVKGADSKEIYLVHLHGRCSDSSFPILDAWGYNVAREDSQEYMTFLRRLLSERHVVVIGSSLADVPLRDAAAFVKRKSLYSNRTHLAFYCEPIRAKNIELTLRNSMRGALGIELLPVTPSNQAQALALMQPLSAGQYPVPPDFKAIGDFFEDTGDYDCEIQHRWLSAQSGSTAPETVIQDIRNVLDSLHSSLMELIHSEAVDAWTSVAKLEKHLRHHRYLYFGSMDRSRSELWLALALHPAASRSLAMQSERSRFEFLVGQHELRIATFAQFNTEVSHKIEALNLEFISSFSVGSVYGERFKLAERVWANRLQNRNSDLPTLVRGFDGLRDELLRVGWESIAAKVCGDKIALQASNAKKNESRQIINRVLDEIDQAEGLARQAGSFWRNFKPSVLRACWTSNVVHARLDILGKIHAARTVANPMLISALVAGLIVCELKLMTRRTLKLDVNERFTRLRKMLAESNLSEHYLRAALNRYWDQYVPFEVFSQLNELEEYIVTADSAC